MAPQSRRLLALALALALVPALAACVSRGTYPPSGYIDTTSGMTGSQRDGKFKQEWVSDDAQQRMHLRTFKKIQVRPLTVDHLTDKDKFKAKDLRKLQSSFQKSFEEKLGENHTIGSAGAPADADTLVVDAALVKIYQPWRLLNLATTT